MCGRLPAVQRERGGDERGQQRVLRVGVRRVRRVRRVRVRGRRPPRARAAQHARHQLLHHHQLLHTRQRYNHTVKLLNI